MQDQMLDLHILGVPIAVIARRFGVSRPTVYEWLEKARQRRAKQALDKSVKDVIE